MQLAIGFFQLDCSTRADFRASKLITAPGRLFVHCFEECRDGGDRFCVRLKPYELRMMAVAFGFAAQDFLREQRLPPKRDQSFGIEIFRVQGPKSHRRKLTKYSATERRKESNKEKLMLFWHKGYRIEADR